MVGIILASHGDFAEGVKQSAAMIFGEQENVAACTLKPSEGPDDIRQKMEQAIASFDDQAEILFLVDLWGGTPFNQANTLYEAHKEKWAIVTGMNLPLVIEAYASRLSMNSAQAIATAILPSGQDGIKTKPESLQKTKEKTITPVPVAPGAIPPGTVLGDGKIKLVLTRVDSRLLHGQVATAWSKATNPNRIIVVSDEVAKDQLRKSLIEQAAPSGIKANVVPIAKMIEIAADPRFGTTKALLLFENPTDVVRVVAGGLAIKEVNVGSIAHSKGKVVVNHSIAMGPDDVAAFDKLTEAGIKFDVRKVPADSKGNFPELLAKAKAELSKQTEN